MQLVYNAKILFFFKLNSNFSFFVGDAPGGME
jgi:hypothetical protein